MSESFREEITRLEALYAGNPGGRVFTHLAEAYRKAGDLDRAREILDRGLRHHDDYASAYVVLGRVMMDLGETDEARTAFRRVIELDRHNMVALRSLGDLANVASDTQEALRHYRELIALDPTDELLRATVARLESNAPATEREPVSESESSAPVVEIAEPASASEADRSGVEAEGSGVDREGAGVSNDVGAEGAGAHDGAVARPGEMVTETMAELYAAQGLHVRAAEVYRSLLRARPGDDRLEERLRQMESRIDDADEPAAGVAVPAAAEYDAASPADDDTPGWLERVESAWTGGGGVAGAGPTPYAWTETAHTVRAGDEDRPISAYFESLLAWRPAERRSDPPVDAGAEAAEPRDTDVDAGTEATEPEMWLDEAASVPVRGETERVDVDGTAEEDEDLEMFRSWLQSLTK